MVSETDEIIKEPFESLLQNYEKRLEESMRGSEFNFDTVGLLYYHLNKISLKRGRSYKDFPKSPKKTITPINPKNNDDKCLQFDITAVLKLNKLKATQKGYQKVSLLLISIIGKEHFLSKEEGWEKFESNNKSVALNTLFVPYNTEEIRLAYS